MVMGKEVILGQGGEHALDQSGQVCGGNISDLFYLGDRCVYRQDAGGHIG